MFARVFTLLPLALLASASHLAARDTVNQCNTGTVACCDQKFDVNQPIASIPGLSIIDAVVAAAAQVGATCSVISLTSCTQQPVCCTNVEQNGLVNVACTPISA